MAPRRLEYSLPQTGQGNCEGPGFVSMSPASRRRRGRKPAFSAPPDKKALFVALGFVLNVRASPRRHAGRAPHIAGGGRVELRSFRIVDDTTTVCERPRGWQLRGLPVLRLRAVSTSRE